MGVVDGHVASTSELHPESPPTLIILKIYILFFFFYFLTVILLIFKIFLFLRTHVLLCIFRQLAPLLFYFYGSFTASIYMFIEGSFLSMHVPFDRYILGLK